MKYPIVLQHSEEDCGAACLATVAKHYGKTFALSRVREVVGTGSLGTTLLGLRRGAETLDSTPARSGRLPNLSIALMTPPCRPSFIGGGTTGQSYTGSDGEKT